MHISAASLAVEPIFLVSFVVLVLQYYFIHSPQRRVLVLRFWLLIGTIVLMAVVPLPTPLSRPLILFPFALFWLGLAVYLYWSMPLPGGAVRRTKGKR